MNKITRILTTVILVGAFVIIINAQTAKRVKKEATPNAVCTVAAVPKGFVIVGYQPSATCKGKPKLLVKLAEDADIVCAASPVPAGFSVIIRTASAECITGNTNPLSNALLIRDSAKSIAVSLPSRRDDKNDDSDAGTVSGTTLRVTVGGQPKKKIDTKMSLNGRDVKVGMTTDEVVGLWGGPTSVDATTRNGEGTSESWHYKRNNGIVVLDFSEGVLTNFRWYH